MIVWCSVTWLSTEPSVYLQFGVLIASSIASEIAVPKQSPDGSMLGEYLRPALVDIDGEAVTCAPKVCMIERR